MRIYVTSVLVDNQAKALEFYTSKLGFIVKHDIPIGEARWLTVARGNGTASRAGRAPGGGAVQSCARQGRNTCNVLHGRRSADGVPKIARPRRDIHGGADGCGR